jgi:hypothetical protein
VAPGLPALPLPESLFYLSNIISSTQR